MIPPPGHPVWIKILSGQKQVMSTQLAVNLLLTNLRLRYRMNRSEENIAKLSRNAREFFIKYENFYQAEVRQLFQ